MYITDRLYGSFELEPVLTDLVNSQAVQRLKHVHQNGASYLVNPKWKNTRFDHSVGVMCLIRRLGGSVEEQIAGLLHDVSHTAFSHVVDDALKQEKEDYHEQIKEEMVMDSDIPAILESYHIDLQSVLDETNWKILEQSAPRLCADRIDYTLRDLYEYGEISFTEAETFIKSITLNDGRMHLDNITSAEWFVEQYYREVLDFFMHPINIYSNHVMAELLQVALKNGVITKEDFLLTDGQLLGKLEDSTDQEIIHHVNRLTDKVTVKETKGSYDIKVKKKMRLIDPEVVIGDEGIPASRLSVKVLEMNQKAKERSEEGTMVKIINH